MFISENSLYGVAPTVHVEADTNYDGAIGCQVALVESYQNDFEFLKASVLADVKECAMIKESASEEEIAAMQEGVLSSVWEKIKTFVKKIWEKIKGIFKGFIARLEVFMGKNAYSFFTKYKKVLYDGSDISKLKFKWQPPTQDALNVNGFAGKLGEINIHEHALNVKDDTESDEIEEMVLKKLCGLDDKKTFAKDFKELYFDSEEEEEASSAKMGVYCHFISDKKSIVDSIKKVADKEDSLMNKWIRYIDKAAEHAAENAAGASKTDYTDKDVTLKTTYNGADKNIATMSATVENKQKLAIKYQKILGAASRALNLYNSNAVSVAKFAVSQSRRVAAIIVAYKSRHKKNESVDSLYLDTVGEAAAYEATSELEAL